MPATLNPFSLSAYDATEATRLTGQWLGATARTFWGQPAFGMALSPFPAAMAAWGEVTERAFVRMGERPDWGIDAVVSEGRDYIVERETVLDRPFGKLARFKANRDERRADGSPRPRVLLVAPMSGHYPTLLRPTVASLLPDCEVYVTEWVNARDVPVSAGRFDVEDFVSHMLDFLRALADDGRGADVHVVAVCQPVPLTLVATAWASANEPAILPASLTLIGGPVDPDANPTDVTDFGRRVTMGELERSVIQTVGASFRGVGRAVYPGVVQLSGFMAMNWDRHARAFTEQIARVARGEAGDHDRHNTFYDEYLAVMDMPAEFYLSTVDRIFKRREVARNIFSYRGEVVDIAAIDSVPVKVVEGGRDDISAPGQCRAAFDLMPHLRQEKRAYHLEPGAGHYGIFSGKAWHNNIRPEVLDFIARHGEVMPTKAQRGTKGRAAARPPALADASVPV